MGTARAILGLVVTKSEIAGVGRVNEVYLVGTDPKGRTNGVERLISAATVALVVAVALLKYSWA